MNFRIWVTLLLLAFVALAMSGKAKPVASQTSGDTLVPYSVPASQPPAAAGKATAGEAHPMSGYDHHIDWAAISRIPCCGWESRFAWDGIVFPSDQTAGLSLHISNAEVHDKWSWRYYEPDGAPPQPLKRSLPT